MLDNPIEKASGIPIFFKNEIASILERILYPDILRKRRICWRLIHMHMPFE